jgi:hypothetical protein
MPTPATTLSLLLPTRAPPRDPSSFVPFLEAALAKDWQYNEGTVEWTVVGVPILTGFLLYPLDQLETVLGVVEGALLRRATSINIPGSNITLSASPAADRATLFASSCSSRSHPGERLGYLEVATPAAPVARATIDAASRLLEHPDLFKPPPTRDAATPRVHKFPELLSTLARLDALCRTRGG